RHEDIAYCMRGQSDADVLDEKGRKRLERQTDGQREIGSNQKNGCEILCAIYARFYPALVRACASCRDSLLRDGAGGEDGEQPCWIVEGRVGRRRWKVASYFDDYEAGWR